jgi:hypothetical protein
MGKRFMAFMLSLAMVISAQTVTLSGGLTVSADDDSKIGDFNQDGNVDVLDFTTLRRAIISGDTSKVSDLNQDGTINTADLLTIKKVIFGLENTKYYGYHFEGKTLYYDGGLYTGFYVNSDGTSIIYVKGKVYTGYYLNEDNVKCYSVNGTPYTGFYKDILYVDGKPHTGVYIDENGEQQYYVDGVESEFEGFHTMTDSSGNTLLYDGNTPYSGFYTDDNGNRKLYQSGRLYSGLYTNTDGSVNGYTNGVLVTGWATFNGYKYYFNPSTYKRVVGVTSINGTSYYFDSQGRLLTNCVIGQWVVNSSGVATSSLKSKAQSVLSTYGSTPSSIYNNYMRVYHKYKHISDSVTLSFSATNDKVTPQIVNYTPATSSVNATGWACFALYTIDRSQASCYYLAALEDYLFREAGYTSRIVYGTQGSGVHYWNQVLVNGTWLNYDPCNAGRGGKTNAQLSAISSAYQWCGYIVPDSDYNGCYYYKTTTDYSNGNYTYLVNSIYYTN